MSDKHPLLKVCIPENYLRCTHYSDIYRAFINLNGSSQFVDIEHIHLPLNEKRSEALQQKYNLSPGELSAYNAALGRSVKNSILLLNRVRNDPKYQGKVPEDNLNAIANYIYQDLCKNDDGSVDVFLVTPTMTQYLKYERYCTIMEGDPHRRETHFTNLVNLFHRTLLTIQRLNAAGVHIGVLDLDSICVVEGLDKEQKPKDFMAITSFLYARYEDENPLPYPSCMPFNAHPDLVNGAKPSLATDLYSWAFLFLTLLNGTYGTSFPDASQRPADCVPKPLVDALYKALNGEASMRELRSVIVDAKRDNPESGQSNNFFVVMNSDQPYYLNEVAEVPYDDPDDSILDESTHEEPETDVDENMHDENSFEDDIVLLDPNEAAFDGEEQTFLLEFADEQEGDGPDVLEDDLILAFPDETIPEDNDEEDLVLSFDEPVVEPSKMERKKAEKEARKAAKKAAKDAPFIAALHTSENFDDALKKCQDRDIAPDTMIAYLEKQIKETREKIEWIKKMSPPTGEEPAAPETHREGDVAPETVKEDIADG